jgi:hypothetical protein
MSAVEVEIAEDVPSGGDEPGGGGAERRERREGPADGEGRRRRREGDRGDFELEREREVTKRQIIQSVSTIVVVILYMVFTLLRDRETGVVVVDPDEGDDWDEGA